MLSQELVRKLKDTSAYVEFQNHIMQEIDKLNSLSGLGDMSNELAGEEVKARVRAMEILEDILSPFVNFAEKQKISPEELQKAKNRFGLS